MIVVKRSRVRPPTPAAVLYTIVGMAELCGTDAVAIPCGGDGDLAVIVAGRVRSVAVIDPDLSGLHASLCQAVWRNIETRRHDVRHTLESPATRLYCFDKVVMDTPFDESEPDLIASAMALVRPGGRLVCLATEGMAAALSLNGIGGTGLAPWTFAAAGTPIPATEILTAINLSRPAPTP